MWNDENRRARILSIVGVIVLFLVTAALVTGFLYVYNGAKTTMDPSGTLTLTTCEDGSLQLQWPAGENAQGYVVEVVDAAGNVACSAAATQCNVVLPELPDLRGLSARVYSMNSYGERIRQSKEYLEIPLEQPSPQIRDLNWSVDTELDMVELSFDMSEGDLCRVYVREDEGENVLMGEVREGKMLLRFGEGQQFDVPQREHWLHITFQLERAAGNSFYEGAISEGVSLSRDHFLSDVVQIQQNYNGDNSYTFSWNEASGAYYDVRMSEDGGKTWETKAYISAAHERSYTTPNLKAFTDYSISIVGVGGENAEEGAFASQSEIMQILTKEKLLYTTIWLINDQKVYSAPDGKQVLDKAPAGSAWCVLGQEGQYFRIYFNGQDAYVNSEYCMINLTEYLGNLCQYDITNSHSSIYLVHEYEIKNVSGTVISGYEDVEVTEGTYLVPLLYPTAQKLLEAGKAARQRGFTLKIYDSFRPQKATDSIYWTTYASLNKRIPAQTYTGKVITDWAESEWIVMEQTEDGKLVPPANISYSRLMTNNGAYYLGSFLAPGTSRHNFGVAVDLTLVDADGKELSMQTSIHDLSWYSAVIRNNANANLLREIMVGAGLAGISSEWWHYQDNEIIEKNLYRPLKTGVSWQCWVADGNGWRYRLNDGSFHANGTFYVGEEIFTFDENGYAVFRN